MGLRAITSAIMENTLAYRLWQAPFVADKFAPIAAANDLRAVRRVLDVGCGPGINTRLFPHSDYVGVDWNPRYIEYARRRYGRTFITADITRHDFGSDRFDFILVNSFLHHVDTENARAILGRLRQLLDPNGYIHSIEVVLPPYRSIPRLLARYDRGHFARPLDEWRSLFGEQLQEAKSQPFIVPLLGVALWEMVYFKGSAKPS